MRGLTASAIALLGMAGVAEAAVLPFDGAFGNAAGCHLFLTGEVTGDDLLVLTGDTVSSFAAGCDFLSLVASEGEVFTVEAVCSGEGQDHPGLDRVVVTNRGDAGLFVKLDGLGEWGPLLPCPGLGELFAPGVRV